MHFQKKKNVCDCVAVQKTESAHDGSMCMLGESICAIKMNFGGFLMKHD